VKEKLKNEQLMDSKRKIRHVKMYLQMKPWKIVEKFKQKLKKLINYYYKAITNKSDLSYYYYVYKYACLKTLAAKTQKSIVQVQKKYGENLRIEHEIQVLNQKNRQKKIMKKISFPSYLLMMKRTGYLIRKNKYKIPGKNIEKERTIL
jgi:hypothetical protein